MMIGKIPINISNKYPELNDELFIDEEKYLHYKNNYIKMEGMPEKPIWEIFCNYLETKN